MVFKKLFVLSAPLIAAEISYISMSFVDAILMGMLGVEVLAGGGLGVTVLHLLTITAIGIVASVGNLVAVSHGAQRVHEVTSALQGGLIASVLLAVIVVLCIVFLELFLTHLNFLPSQINFAIEYVNAATPSVLALLIFRVFRGFATGLHYTTSVFKISLFSALINIPVSYSLMVGAFGLPECGLAGIGYGTSIVCWTMVGLIIIDLLRKGFFSRYKFWNLKNFTITDFSNAIVPVFQLGCPIALAYGLEAGLYTATTFLVSTLGDVSLAAHHVVLRCTSVTFRLPAAIAQASSVMVGQHYGEGDMQSIRKVTKAGVTLCLIVSASTSLIYICMPELIIEMFLRETDTNFSAFSHIAIPLLMLVGVFQFIASLQVVIMGVLRGLKQTTGPTAVTAIGYWLIGFPFAYLLMSSSDLGVVGVWAGLGVGLTVTLFLLFRQYQRVQATLFYYV